MEIPPPIDLPDNVHKSRGRDGVFMAVAARLGTLGYRIMGHYHGLDVFRDKSTSCI